MKNVWYVVVLLVAGPSIAYAGGIDWSGQSIAPIFEIENYAELSFRNVSPDISGTAKSSFSGDMAGSYFQTGAAYKRDLSYRLSFALIYDQPYGANARYPTRTGYAFAGSTAGLRSHALSGIVRYKFDDGFSVHGGLRAQALEANVSIPAVSDYTAIGDRDQGIGYLAGVAYEKPKTALRVALTYFSEVEHKLATSEFLGSAQPDSTTVFNTPQAMNLDFQTGILRNMLLLFGGVRWVDWSAFEISPTVYTEVFSRPLIDYVNDTFSYTLGVGRKLNKKWSASVALSYEKHQDVFFTNLGPSDGRRGLTLGVRYRKDNMMISGGINYTKIGNTKTVVNRAPLITSSFTDNSAIGAGIKVGYYL